MTWIHLNLDLSEHLSVNFPWLSGYKNLHAMQGTQEMRVLSLRWENALEEEMATRSSIFTWRIPWTERSLAGYSPKGRKELDLAKHIATELLGLTALDSETLKLLLCPPWCHIQAPWV